MRGIARPFVLLSLLAAAAGASSWFVARDRPARSPSGLELRIHALRTEFLQGETTLFDFEAEIRNLGPAPVILVQPGDGSDIGWRAPRVGWTSLPVNWVGCSTPDPLPPWTGGRCGNVDPLTQADLFELAPGSSRPVYLCPPDIFMIPGGSRCLRIFQPNLGRLRPGEYWLRFYYENDPEFPWKQRFESGASPAVLRTYHRSARSTLTSNEVRVRIRSWRSGSLRGARLRGIMVEKADLRGADLRRGDFSWSSFRESDLRGARLAGADLRDSELRHCRLAGADLRGADLRGADLRESPLSGVRLDGIRCDRHTVWPDGFRPPGRSPDPVSRGRRLRVRR